MDYETASKYLRYDPHTGIIYRKVKTSNNTKPLGVADCMQDSGYLKVRLNNRRYLSHRLAWLLVTGSFPRGEIDHINGIKHDNRWVNLRDVTHQTNVQNAGLYKTNTSGVSGVGWCCVYKKWKARIQVSGKRFSLGYHEDWFDAVCAKKAAEYKFKFHPNHGRARDAA